jgi:hypothetical protein
VVINREKFKLGEGSYMKEIHPKKLIVIGNTMTSGMSHYDAWTNKISGKYKKTAAYTVTLNGKIYEHYDPKYYSRYVGCGLFDRKIIPIALENEGWLIKDFKTNVYINWAGEVYERDEELVEKSWRGRLRWAPYSKKQLDSLAFLCEDLIKRFDIPRFVSPNNVIVNQFTKKSGIYYRSNESKTSLDVSPAFDIKYLKDKIEE